MDVIDKETKKFDERINEVEAAIRMVDLKMRAEKKTKFVQYFADMTKQVDAIISKNNNELIIENSITQVEVPDFNYTILSKSEIPANQDKNISDKSV